MMPGQNSYDVCRAIRDADPDIPIIFISAKSEEIDKVVGFEIGADDFIMKPFGVREVVARIRAVTRRCIVAGKTSRQEPFEIGDLTVNSDELRATRGETTIDLILRDVGILELLAQNTGKVLD